MATMTEKQVKDAVEQKAILDANNSEKANQNFLAMTADDLRKRIADMKSEIQSISNELETKIKAHTYLNNEILAANTSLSTLKASFEGEKKNLIDSLAVKHAEADTSNAEYQGLLRDNREKNNLLQSELQKVKDERASHKSEMTTILKNNEDIKAEAVRRENDVKAREEELAKAKEEFEAYKSTIEPEISKVSEIVNENKLLLFKIESDKNNFNAQQANFERQKLNNEESLKMQLAQVNQEALRLRNENARLKQFEQDLKDFDMQIKVRESEAIKMRDRFQLQEKFDKSQTKTDSKESKKEA